MRSNPTKGPHRPSTCLNGNTRGEASYDGILCGKEATGRHCSGDLNTLLFRAVVNWANFTDIKGSVDEGVSLKSPR